MASYLVKFAFLLLVVGLVKSNLLGGPTDVRNPNPISKVLIEEPILIKAVDASGIPIPPQDIQKAQPEVEQESIPMPRLKPKLNTDNLQLDPIPSMLPQFQFGMPSFIQQILDSIKSGPPTLESDQDGSNGEIVNHGKLTILLMKSIKPAENFGDIFGDKPLDSQDDQGVKTKKVIMYRFMPRLGGKGDPDSEPNFMIDHQKNSVNLLGGIRDMDLQRFDLMKQSNNLLGQDDLDKLRDPFFFGQLPPLIGAEHAKIESFDPSTLNNDQDDSMVAKIKEFFNNMGHETENFEADFLKTHDLNDKEHKTGKKKCMMMTLMRLKSNVYFRTVLHLLFFSGLLMILLCLTMLTVRNIKRRRALLAYSKNIQVATIEGSDHGKGASSDVKSAMSNTAFLVQAPPAYDQITIGGEEKRQGNDKYSKLKNEDENDTKSLTSSLPDYEQTVMMKEEEEE